MVLRVRFESDRVCAMRIFRSICVLALVICVGILKTGLAQTQPAIPPPDERYKADILLVVAHPDDDTGASTYLAKAVFDEKKRVAVIFTNRGGSGGNAVGMEQGKALEDEREMEARRSLAERGITNVWFLNGKDTPTQDVLHSLETVGHGAALEEVVRLVRLTRPDVIITWLPAYVAGENHGDHQASGVLAVEAFDLAGNPTVFPEQVSAPRWHGGIENYGEGLHPWQAKKIYFFSDATHPDFLKGHGPTYLASEISQTKGISFAEINRRAWKLYATQDDFDEKTLNEFANAPEDLVLGRSLVSAPADADVMAAIDDKPIEFHAAPGFHLPSDHNVTLELGGPWAYYKQFYPAHGLESLENLVPPQSSLSYNSQLWVPLLLRNGSAAAVDVTLRSELPAGWSGDKRDGVYHLEPRSSYPVQLFLTAPSGTDRRSPQILSWTLTGKGIPDKKTELSVYLEYNGVPQ